MTVDNEASEKRFLDAVERRLNEVLSRTDPLLPKSAELLSAVARHLCLTGNAKRVRPLLTYYFGLALSQDPLRLVDAAVASELLHSASLLHDDVVDDASTRRGASSANAKWSNSIAVLAGNHVLSVAFELLSGYPMQLTRDSVRVISHMTKAAIAEVEIRSKLEVSEAVWREIARGKTGALFGMCGLAAARLVGDEDAAQRAIRCGAHIGIVFQMKDDVLDIIDNAGLKDRYSDLKNKEPSFPIIVASENPEFKAALRKAWDQETVTADEAKRLGDGIVACGAIDQTRGILAKEVGAALDALGHLAYTEGGQKIIYWLKRLEQCEPSSP